MLSTFDLEFAIERYKQLKHWNETCLSDNLKMFIKCSKKNKLIMKKFLYLIAIVFCTMVVSCTTTTNGELKERFEAKNTDYYSRCLDTIEVAEDSFVVNAVYPCYYGVAVEKIHSFTTK